MEKVTEKFAVIALRRLLDGETVTFGIGCPMEISLKDGKFCTTLNSGRGNQDIELHAQSMEWFLEQCHAIDVRAEYEATQEERVERHAL